MSTEYLRYFLSSAGVSMTIKERVKELCRNKGVTAAKLEKECGFANGYVSKLDKSTPTTKNMQKIADYFGVTVEYLMTGEMRDGYYLNQETANIAQQIFENKELSLLFDVQKDMSPEDLQAIYQMALALKRKESN